MADDFGFFSSSEGAGAEEDPAAAFLAQQESEIAGIENDEGFGPTEGEAGAAPSGQAAPPEQGERGCGARPAPLPPATGGLPTSCSDGGLCPFCPKAGKGPPGRIRAGLGSPGDAQHPRWVVRSVLHLMGRWRGDPVGQAGIPARAVWACAWAQRASGTLGMWGKS